MQQYTASQVSLLKTGGVTITEEYIPLWLADGTYVSTTSSSFSYIQDGTTTLTATASKIFSINPNAQSNQKYALEATMFADSSNVAEVIIYDITSGSAVINSDLQTSNTTTTATVLRTGTFTLTPGHSYGLYFRNGTTVNGNAHIVDASLVVFG